jgi:hypothetical protein
MLINLVVFCFKEMLSFIIIFFGIIYLFSPVLFLKRRKQNKLENNIKWMKMIELYMDKKYIN